MSKTARIVMVLAMVTAAAACARQPDPAPVEPITVEPTETGKFK